MLSICWGRILPAGRPAVALKILQKCLWFNDLPRILDRFGTMGYLHCRGNADLADKFELYLETELHSKI